MNIYLKLLTITSFIAFTIIKKANFRLDADNLGLIAAVTIITFAFNYFSTSIYRTTQNPNFGNEFQSAIVSSQRF